ncbi:hypothetical protein Aura_00056 [Pseudomonas phage vB_PpuM-Aura]
MTNANVEAPDGCGVLLLDVTSPDFVKFMSCGLRFLREARQITFPTQKLWDQFCLGEGRPFTPWVSWLPEPMAEIQKLVTGKVVATGIFDTRSFIEVRKVPGLKDTWMRVMYAESKARTFNSRIEALRECGTKRDDWWDEVVVGWKEA